MRAALIVLGATASVAAKSHANDFHFKNAGDLKWIEKGSIPPYTRSSMGPDDSQVTVTSSGNTVVVESERKGGPEPAEFFKAGLSPDMYVGAKTSNDQPANLNFAIKGNVSMLVGQLKLMCPDMRLGQGHKGGVQNNWLNNWWLGGPGCTHGGEKDVIDCPCETFSSAGAPMYKLTWAHFTPVTANEYTVTLPEESCTLSAREGSWTAISSAPGTYRSKYHSSSEVLTYKEVLSSIGTTLTVPLTFGILEMKASAAYNYHNQMTNQIEEEKKCSITLPEGLRLWEWTYSVQSSCGTASIASCCYPHLKQ